MELAKPPLLVVADYSNLDSYSENIALSKILAKEFSNNFIDHKAFAEYHRCIGVKNTLDFESFRTRDVEKVQDDFCFILGRKIQLKEKKNLRNFLDSIAGRNRITIGIESESEELISNFSDFPHNFRIFSYSESQDLIIQQALMKFLSSAHESKKTVAKEIILNLIEYIESEKL